MKLSHNLASLNIYKNYTKAVSEQSRAMRNISSGLKVSSAKDNPNVLPQSEKMQMQIRGLQMAGKNLQDGSSMLQTADGGLDNMTSMLQRIRELTLQAGNGTSSDQDKAVIQNEINQLIEGYDSMAENTEFNGVKLLKDGKSIGDSDTINIEIQLGANSGEKLKVPIYNLTSTSIPVDRASGNCLADIRVTDISEAIKVIESTLDSISSVRSKYGAIENRLDSTLNNVNEISEKMENGFSILVDADIATEMMNYSKADILSQAGNAMMVQSNKFPQEVLAILGNIRTR